MPELYRVWYQNGTEPTSTLSMATSLEAIEFTERNNTDFLRAEVATLTQAELEWQAEMMLPVVRMAMERCECTLRVPGRSCASATRPKGGHGGA